MSSNTTVGMDFDFRKLSIEAKYRVLPFHLHVFRWNYHLVTQVSRHFKMQIFTALIMHYRKNSIQHLTEAKSPAVPVISVGQTLTTTPFGWHSPEVKVMVSWLLTQDTIFFKDQLPGHCKGKQTWKRSRRSSAHSISALQILCVFLKPVF